MDQGGRERIAGADCVLYFNPEPRMLMAAMVVAQQAAVSSSRDANQFQLETLHQISAKGNIAGSIHGQQFPDPRNFFMIQLHRIRTT